MSSKTNNRPRSSQGSNNNSKAAAAPAAASAPTAGAPNAWGNPAPNAWSRPLKPRLPPGLSPPSAGGLKGNLDPAMRERFLHLTLTLVGQRVTLNQDDGTVLEGVFHTATPFADLSADKKNRYILKAVLVVKGDTDKIPNGSTVVVPANKVTSLHCKSLRLGVANGKGETFRTDTEISSTQNDKGRDLVAAGTAWTAAGNSRADALNDGPAAAGPRKVAGLKGHIGEWDQFRANEELFNVQAKFDENLYTTELDKSAMDTAKIKQAERMAREIENTTSSNIHVAEERNQAIQGDYDEEDRYSGVLTNNLQTRSKDGAPAPKKMNYAAAAANAAAKADAAKLGPPGFAGKKDDAKAKEEKKPDVKDSKKSVSPKKGAEETKPDSVTSKGAPEKSSGDSSKQEEKKTVETENVKPAKAEVVVVSDAKKEAGSGQNGEAASKEENSEDSKVEEEKKAATKLKLNPNAKTFSFNPGAKTFMPSFGTPAPAPPAAEPQQMVDPNTGVPVQPQIPGQPPYMHHMGQPGMMPMMNQQFAMRYPGGYPGMEQVPSGQPPQHMQHPHMHQQNQPHEGATAQVGGNEQQQTGDSVNQTPHQPQQQQHPQAPPQHPGMPVQYPPNASPYHYVGAMQMHARGPGGPHMAYPQMVGQQIPVVPGRNPYSHAQHMYAMPPPPPMRGPNGAPFYPSAAPHYPQYMAGEDDYRGGGRGGRGAGRGRRGGRKGGRGGRGGYWQHNPREQGMHNGGGRHTPQNATSEEQSPATDAMPPASKEEPSSTE